jgi:hypothetical protein
MLDVIMQVVNELSAFFEGFIHLSVINSSIVMLDEFKLNVCMLSVFLLSVIY